MASTDAGADEIEVPDGVDFEEVQQDAKQTISELERSGMPLSEFREEYVRLLRALEKSYDNELAYEKRVASVVGEIEEHRRSREEVEQEQEDMEAARAQLDDEVQNALAEIGNGKSALRERDDEVRETRARLEELQVELDAGPGWQTGQEEQRDQLESERDRLRHMVDGKQGVIHSLRDQIDAIHEHVEQEEQRHAAVQRELGELTEGIEAKKKESRDLQAEKDNGDRDLRELQEIATEQGRRLRIAEEESQSRLSEAMAAQKDTRQLKQQLERMMKVYERLEQRVTKLSSELDTESATNENIAQELNELETVLRERESEIQVVQREKRKLEKKYNMGREKVQQAEEQGRKIRRKEEKIKERQDQVAQECQAQRKANRALRKELDKRKQERELLQKGVRSRVDATKAFTELVRSHQETIANIEVEINGYRQSVRELREKIEELQSERSRYSRECDVARTRYREVMERVKMREVEIGAVQRKVAEQESRLRNQQQMYESVRADRARYNRNLIDAEAEIDTMRRRFESMTYQINQLREELTSKDYALVQEHFRLQRVEKDVERVNAELTTVEKQIQSSEQIISSQEREIVKLQQIVKEADEEHRRQEKEYTSVVGERDMLRTQLVKRDEELSQLYEKIKIQRSALRRGASQYEQHRQEMERIEKQVSELQGEVQLSQAQTANLPELDREAKQLDEQLMHERTKVRTLTEELRRPLNVHRWRSLEVTDPERFRLIQRVASLQRRVMEAQDELARKDELVQKKETVYSELKRVMARQPGPEMDEEVQSLSQQVKAKKKELRAMQEEVENNKNEVDDLKREMQLLQDRIHAMNQTWVASTRRQQRASSPGDTTASASLSRSFSRAMGGHWPEDKEAEEGDDEDVHERGSAVDERPVEEHATEPQW